MANSAHTVRNFCAVCATYVGQYVRASRHDVRTSEHNVGHYQHMVFDHIPTGCSAFRHGVQSWKFWTIMPCADGLGGGEQHSVAAVPLLDALRDPKVVLAKRTILFVADLDGPVRQQRANYLQVPHVFLPADRRRNVPRTARHQRAQRKNNTDRLMKATSSASTPACARVPCRLGEAPLSSRLPMWQEAPGETAQ